MINFYGLNLLHLSPPLARDHMKIDVFLQRLKKFFQMEK